MVVWRAGAGPPRHRLTATVFGWVIVAIGVGSIAFHGPQPAGARFVHDLPIAAVLAFIALHGFASAAGWRARPTLGAFATAVAGAGVLLAAWPDADAALFAVLALAAAGGEWAAARTGLRARAGAYLAAAAVLAGGALLNLTGRTDGPLCDAGSIVQLHAVWHVATAAALVLWAHVALPGPVAAAAPEH